MSVVFRDSRHIGLATVMNHVLDGAQTPSLRAKGATVSFNAATTRVLRC